MAAFDPPSALEPQAPDTAVADVALADPAVAVAPPPAAAAAPATAESDEGQEPRFHNLFPVLEEQRIYLDLMNMGSANGLSRCEELVRKSENPRIEAYLLLESANWRRKLVGVCWLLYHGMDRAARTLLWRAADGSWVSPQASAVAFLLDRLFRTEVEQRLRAARAAGRPLSKSLGAMAGLYERLPDGAPGIKAWLRSPEAVYLPEGEWVHLWTGAAASPGWQAVNAPLGRPAVFYRRGSAAGEALRGRLLALGLAD